MIHHIKIESWKYEILSRKSYSHITSIIFLTSILISLHYAFGDFGSTNDIVENKYNSGDNNQKTFHDLSNLDEKTLSNFKNWFGYLVNWLDASLISDKEFFDAIDFLNKKEIIKQNPNEIKEIFLNAKIYKQTILTLVDFRPPRFNEGDPIVFEGKLTDYLGNRISDGSILIKSDGPCPSNHIIAKGITDKYGGYKIYAKTLLWDENDGLITVFAEFSGAVNLEQSVSDSQIVVVYPIKGEKCNG